MDRDASMTTTSVEETSRLRVENEQLKSDMSWLANQAKQNKM